MTSISILVTVDSTASMKRLGEVANELAAGGMSVSHTMQSLNMISGTVDDRHLIPEFRKIADVKGIVIKSIS